MKKKEKIYASRLIDGKCTQPQEPGKSVNSDATEQVILVAPDEKHMLIGQTKDGRDDEPCVSYERTSGSWTSRVKTPLGVVGSWHFHLTVNNCFLLETAYIGSALYL